MEMFFKVVNGHIYPEKEEEVHPYCPEWEIPRRLYPIEKKLSLDDLNSLALLLTNPNATLAQLRLSIQDRTYKTHYFVHVSINGERSPHERD